MELVKIVWVINFFFLALILIFIWSKLNIIARKIKLISDLIDKAKEVENISKNDNHLPEEVQA